MHGVPQRWVQHALQRAVLERLPELDLPDARLVHSGLQAKVIVQKVASALV